MDYYRAVGHLVSLQWGSEIRISNGKAISVVLAIQKPDHSKFRRFSPDFKWFNKRQWISNTVDIWLLDMFGNLMVKKCLIAEWSVN